MQNPASAQGLRAEDFPSFPVCAAQGDVLSLWRFHGEAATTAQMRAANRTMNAVEVGEAVTTKTRSAGEVKFEKWCEGEPKGEWVYRNDDKGDEYFSIVYEDNSGHQRLFLPDYIARIGGETWIVEVKGGWTSGGASANIDPYAAKKAAALAAYCAKWGVRGAFIRYEESEDCLLAAEGGYSDDANDPCWKEIFRLAPRVRL